MNKIIALALVGFAAQMVDGSLGMAYGVTSSSLLLAAGFAPAAVSASVHLAEIGTTLASGTSHWRFGNVDWKVVRRIGLPGALGGFAGATVLSNLSTEKAKPWMAALLLLLGVYILLRFARGVPMQVGLPEHGSRFLAPLGLVAGFVDSTGGGGWGPIATPTLISAGRMQPRTVIGTVDTSEFLVAVGASLGFLLGLRGQGIVWNVVLALLIGGMVAAPLAAFLVRVIPTAMLGSLVGGLIIFTNARQLMKSLHASSDTVHGVYALIVLVWVVAVVASVRLVIRQRREQRLLHDQQHHLREQVATQTHPGLPAEEPSGAQGDTSTLEFNLRR